MRPSEGAVTCFSLSPPKTSRIPPPGAARTNWHDPGRRRPAATTPDRYIRRIYARNTG